MELRLRGLSPGRRLLRGYRPVAVARRLWRLWPVLGLIGLWQAWISIQHIDKLVMPSPAAVAQDLVTHPGVYLGELQSTLAVVGLGVVGGMGAGVLMAIASWYSPILAGLAAPPAVIAQSVPVVAMTPVIARVLGYNQSAVIAIAAIIVFFPTFVFVSSGLRSVSADIHDVFSVLAATRATRLWRLALPAAIPSFLLALRLTVAQAVLAALVAEWLMSARGLGALLALSSANFEVARVWGVAVLGTALAVTCFMVASKVEVLGRDRFT